MKYSNIFTILAVTIAIIAASGCKRANNNQPVYHPYDGTEEAEAAKDENGTYVIFAGNGSTEEILTVDVNGNVGETFATSISYEMYTNAGDWEVLPDYSECFYPDASWITVWPPQGSGDGKFQLTFAPNSGAYAQGDVRTAYVNIVSKGKIIKTIVANQAGASQVSLDLVATFMSSLRFAAIGSKPTTVPIDANVAWSAYVDDPEATWVHIDNIEKFSLTISVDDNYDTEERQTSITIYQLTDVDNTISINIRQSGFTLLTDVVAKSNINCIKGGDVQIEAKGTLAEDTIEIASTLYGGSVYYAPLKLAAETCFIFAMPEEVVDGPYNISLVRGTTTEFLFSTEIKIVLVQDVVSQPKMELNENGTGVIEAVGALLTDKIVFVSKLDGGQTYDAQIVDAMETYLTFSVPAGLINGQYEVQLVRDTESMKLFDTEVTVIPAN